MQTVAQRSSRSLRLVFAAVGSRGDVQPMVALAQAAAARGHRPLVAAPPNFESWVRECGCEFAPFGMDIVRFFEEEPAMLTGNPLKAQVAIQKAILKHMPAQVGQLQQACVGADALAWGGVAFVAPSVAEWARLPCLGVVYSTCVLPSATHAPPLVPWRGLPHWANRLLWRLSDVMMERALGPVLHPARESMRLPRRSVKEQFLDRGDYAIAVDEELFPSDPQWDRARFARTNFIYLEDERSLDPELDAWLQDGEPPVFAGFGSMAGDGPKRAARALHDAIAPTGRRCLIGAGWAGLGAGDLPRSWRVVGDVPHAKLFPRVALAIHHGGAGTTANALRAGTRQVLLPLLLDQYHHAHVLYEAQLAPRAVAMERVNGASLATCIDEAMRLPDEPRLAVAQRLKASDGAAQTIELLERKTAP